MTSSNDKKKEHFGFFEDAWKNIIDNKIVLGGILVIIILIIVAVMMWQKQHSSVSTFSETATKYLLTNTPQLLAFD